MVKAHGDTSQTFGRQQIIRRRHNVGLMRIFTDSQAEAEKRLVPFQSYLGMREVLDLLTADE